MKVSLIQVAVRDRDPFHERIARVVDLIRGERGSDLVVLPELWPRGAFSFEDLGESLDGPVLSAIAQAAREAMCYVHAGSIVERNPGGLPYNTSVLFAPDGRRIAVYRKIHLYGFDKGEAVLFEPGQRVVTANTPFGNIGLATCFDLRFPELFRAMLSDGARLFIVPAAWPVERVKHWRLLLRARAVENQAFVFGCSATGRHAGRTTSGHSAVIDPNGEVLAEAGPDGEEVLRAEIDLSAISQIRSEFPVLEWRRLGVATPEQHLL
jgi:predicted amidohydrolase